MTALVTGGSRGIGRAIAVELAQAGHNIALLYAGQKDAAEETASQVEAQGREAMAIRCDVADYAACEEAVAKVTRRFGGFDVLVNNAGITRDSLMLRMSEAQWDECLDVNLKGAFNMIRHSTGQFIKRRGGCIVNISSAAGTMGNAGQANYAAAKAGLIGLTKSMARELATRGITCNAVTPGFIKTDMTHAMPGHAAEALLSRIPLKAPGSALDVARLVAFLASPGARYITGAVIPVDGGLSM